MWPTVPAPPRPGGSGAGAAGLAVGRSRRGSGCLDVLKPCALSSHEPAARCRAREAPLRACQSCCRVSGPEQVGGPGSGGCRWTAAACRQAGTGRGPCVGSARARPRNATWFRSPSRHGAAGCVATLLHDAAMNPAEVVKQRMQMYNSPYQHVMDCVRAVWHNEGAGAFYRSYTTQLTMNIPFQAIHFMTYEFLQEQLNPHRQYNPGSHVVSGACAGAVAAAATTPLDVCKTLLNTQESLALSSNISGHITGMANAFRTVYQVGGVTAYFRGVQARVIFQMPSTAIAWSVYEFFKYILTKRQEERRAGK
ncbi:mitoferrin-2 isoform X3 [Taeniopygia guttata]|uniref:mitoferrin-2 isoform X3 n=1 Tax=Taeniopygia guttata TaxID=59729 RepID=UPI003BB85F3E